MKNMKNFNPEGCEYRHQFISNNSVRLQRRMPLASKKAADYVHGYNQYLRGVMRNVAHLHHATEAIEGGIVGVARLYPSASPIMVERGTYKTPANSNVEDKVQRALGNSSPDTRVADASTGHLVELTAINRPADGLLVEIATAAVNLHAPGVPTVVADGSGRADAAPFLQDVSDCL